MTPWDDRHIKAKLVELEHSLEGQLLDMLRLFLIVVIVICALII